MMASVRGGPERVRQLSHVLLDGAVNFLLTCPLSPGPEFRRQSRYYHRFAFFSRPRPLYRLGHLRTRAAFVT